MQYLGLIGNTFHTKDIDRAVELGRKYNPNRLIVEAQKVMGKDPGWGSSAFGLVRLHELCCPEINIRKCRFRRLTKSMQ